jgi:hypothetical protein
MTTIGVERHATCLQVSHAFPISTIGEQQQMAVLFVVNVECGPQNLGRNNRAVPPPFLKERSRNELSRSKRMHPESG